MRFLRRLLGLESEAADTPLAREVERAMAELGRKTREHQALFDIGAADWAADLDAGTLTFTAPDGRVATASVQVVGTYNIDDGSFLWGWDHPSVPPGLDRAAQAAKAWGEANGEALLTTRKLEVTEAQCWEFTALACQLVDAAGGYRGPAGSALVFMTYDDLVVAEPGGSEVGVDWPEWAGVASAPAGARDAVVGFLADRHAWEVNAAGKPVEAFEAIAEAYEGVVAKWAHPSVVPQPASWRSPAGWDPARYRIEEAGASEDRCRFRVVDVDTEDYASPFEFRLVHEDGRWWILSMLFDDGEGLWESL